MRSYWFSRSISSVLAAASLLAAGTASAQATQEGMALNRYNPSAAGDRMFGVDSPFVAGTMTPHAMLLFDYAHNPLVVRNVSDDASIGSIVSNQLFMHLAGNFALWNRLAINIDVPVALFQSGDSPIGDGISFRSPEGAQFGDIRLGLRASLIGKYHDPFQVSVGGYFWVPTGASDSFVSDGNVRGMPQLLFGGLVRERLVWSANMGAEFRKAPLYPTVSDGTMFRWGVGVGYLIGQQKRLQVGAEVYGGVTLEDPRKETINAELLASARYRIVDDVELGVGMGPGLTSGVGTPDFRGVLMAAYTPMQKPPAPPPPPDRDKDGIADSKDACPDVFGVMNPDPAKNGCPLDSDNDGIIDAKDACPTVPGVPNEDPTKNGCPPDQDGDGIIDAEDACPTVAGVKNDDPKKNGCPPDRDDDGIPDAEDACPDIKGVKSTDPAQNGCPPDTDGDTIRDDKDACPNEKGAADPDPKKHGCPKAVRVTEQEIVILQQVQFDTARATIKPVSNELLDEVAGVLKEHPELIKLEVQGHTDNRGPKKLNEKLSDDRAKAVLKALVARGIDASRLEAKGYGPNKPIADNKTEEGRQKNRRVQFVILEKAKKQQSQ